MQRTPTVPTRRTLTRALSAALIGCSFAGLLEAQGSLGAQQRTQKISELEGGFGGPLSAFDFFGSSCATIGDLDGDGNDDLAVGSRDTAIGSQAAVWILFLNPDGTVRAESKIPIGASGASDAESDVVGTGLAPLGDLDADGVLDLAVGDPLSNDGGVQRGAVHLLFLNPDGSLKSRLKISSTLGGFAGALDDGDSFGSALAQLDPSTPGALLDLAVGASGDDEGGMDRGAVWILSLAQGGGILAERKIGQGTGGFGGTLADGDAFGTSLSGLGDIDGDGSGDLAVGAELDDEGALDAGAVWILFRDAGGAVLGEQKIGAASGSFAGPLEAQDNFGSGITAVGDLDADGIPDLAVGAPGDDDGDSNRGAVWLLFLEQDGTVDGTLKLSDADPGFGGTLANGDFFGSSLGFSTDLDGNGLPEMIVGAPGDDDGGDGHGAIYVVFFQFPGTVVSNGSGINPLALQGSLTPPHIGGIWDPLVEDSFLPLLGGITFNLIGVSSQPLNPGLNNLGANVVGELLIDLSQTQLQFTQSVAPGQRFSIPIALDVSLIGLDFFTQAVAVRSSAPGATTLTMTNRLDLIIGFPPGGAPAASRAALASSLERGLDRSE